MARVLILSSYVASSRVGGGAQALALARLGIEPILIPTTLFGRHPGHGPPGGATVAGETMQAMLEAVAAQGLFAALDAVITGHFSTPEQVQVACAAIDRVREARPAARVVVDPIMGDAGKGLYVREAVAVSLAESLVPRADLIAPNAWELARLAGHAANDATSALTAARALGRPALVSSIETAEGLGVLYADAERAWLATHAAAPSAPKGTGDLLTALFAAGLVLGLAPPEALAAAVSGVVEAVLAADGADELPVAAFPATLAASPRVRLALLDE
jgi:pyridoxine kinase